MDLAKIKAQAKKEISVINNSKDLERWRVKFLGRKSALSLFFANLKNLSLTERREQGAKANKLREFLKELYRDNKERIAQQEKEIESWDISRPGTKTPTSHLHPLTLTLREITQVFSRLGFAIVEGPEIESEYYNFDALRIPPSHPARDMWDTLWLKSVSKKGRLLLRTHTSPVQIRYMEKHQPPFRIIVPGRCFRHEATDVSHDIQFHQVEGLMVDEEVSLANFKDIIETAIRELFSQKVKIRFRPSYFPFVSPGVEVDIKIRNKKSGAQEWMEIMGAGMVHPDLFETVGYNKNLWQGFAFGVGVERIAMIKYNIPDIRLFFSSDIRFLKQF